MSKPTLYIHIGPYRTGSTTIQKTLDSNTAFLAKNNFVYPRKSYFFNAHHNFVFELAKDNRFHPEEGSLLDLFEFLAPHTQHVLLSSENYDLLKTEDQLFKLKQQFENNYNVKIIGVFRNQVEWIESYWGMQLFYNFVNKHYEGWYPIAMKLIPLFDFGNYIKKFEAVFGIENIIIIPFDGTDKFAVLKKLLAHCGMEFDQEFKPNIEFNRSHTALLHEVFRRMLIHLNEMNATFSPKELKVFIYDKLASQPNAHMATCFTSPKIREAISQYYATNNEDLFKRYAHFSIQDQLYEKPKSFISKSQDIISDLQVNLYLEEFKRKFFADSTP